MLVKNRQHLAFQLKHSIENVANRVLALDGKQAGPLEAHDRDSRCDQVHLTNHSGQSNTGVHFEHPGDDIGLGFSLTNGRVQTNDDGSLKKARLVGESGYSEDRVEMTVGHERVRQAEGLQGLLNPKIDLTVYSRRADLGSYQVTETAKFDELGNLVQFDVSERGADAAFGTRLVDIES